MKEEGYLVRSGRKQRRFIGRSARQVGIGVLSLSMLTGCSLLDAFRSEEPAAEAPALKTVRVETVAVRRIEEPVFVVGDVLTSLRMDVVVDIGGKVEQVYKRLGETVKEGEPLAKLSSADAEQARSEAAAALDRARAAVAAGKQALADGRKELSVEIKKMELEHERLVRARNKTKNDYDGGTATKSALDEAELQVEASRIDLELARQRLRSMTSADAISSLEAEANDAEQELLRVEEALRHLEVVSPITGIITAQTLIEGTFVKAGEVVGTIDRVDPLRISARLNEEAANLVRGKTDLQYALPGGEATSRANIHYLTSIMDPETKTYEISLEAPGVGSGLKPGMKVSVQLTEDADQTALGIPQYSVIEDGTTQYVFVLQGDVVEKREVRLGRSNANYYEVLSGVREGEKLVVMGQAGLQDREQVFSVEAETASEPGAVQP